ncbi:MAG TPA: hypothetical protein EYG66_05725 [Mariprofundaceae bacterium]|nr:hypothetical protein [Mariprofundaceae bacterium]
MNNDWEADIQTLLNNTRIAFLSTQGDKSPETSMCPYAVFQDDVVLHLSALAKHSKNIQQHTQVGLMICSPETPDKSPLALPRLSFTGHIETVPEAEQADYQKAYLQSIPDAEPLFSFPDFTLYRIQPLSVSWVGGFGKARKIPLETWKSLC